MNVVKKGTAKLIGFDTDKNYPGLLDLVMALVNPSTGAIVAGTEVTMTELKVDSVILSAAKAAVVGNVTSGSSVVTVAPADTSKFGVGDIVEVKNTGGTGASVFATTKIKSINSTSGVIELEGIALIGADATADTPQIQLADATGTYKAVITAPDTAGTYLVWVRSKTAGIASQGYTYGTLEVVDYDLVDVMNEIGNIKTSIAGGAAASFGRILQ